MWLEARQAVRALASEDEGVRQSAMQRLERIKPTLVHLCYAANHHNVAAQILQNEVYQEVLHPKLAECVREHQTAQWSSKEYGNGAGLVFFNERLHHHIKKHSKGCQDINYLKDHTLILNAVFPCEEQVGCMCCVIVGHTMIGW